MPYVGRGEKRAEELSRRAEGEMTSHGSHLPCAFGRQAEMGNPPKVPVVREGRQAHKKCN